MGVEFSFPNVLEEDSEMLTFNISAWIASRPHALPDFRDRMVVLPLARGAGVDIQDVIMISECCFSSGWLSTSWKYWTHQAACSHSDKQMLPFLPLDLPKC